MLRVPLLEMLGGELGGEGWEEFGGRGGIRYRLALKDVAMGNGSFVDIFQETHRSRLQRHQSLSPEVELAYCRRLPLGPAHEGFYIDDHFAIGIALRHKITKSRSGLGPTSSLFSAA